jgi:hypothetical protein
MVTILLVFMILLAIVVALGIQRRRRQGGILGVGRNK